MNTDSYETYGSANLKVEFIDDKKGKKLKITCYLKICIITRLVIMTKIELWHLAWQKMWLLEQTIRRKWKKVKDLPLVNVIFKKFKGKGTFFNAEIYLEGD